MAASGALAGAAACGDGNGGGGQPEGLGAGAPPPPITVSWSVPQELAAGAGLPEAAAFAWQEFIALNWAAVPQTGALNTRDYPDTSQVFGSTTYSGPLVWHTFRSKVEIFPAPDSTPQGYVNNAGQSYGYDHLPQYIYAHPIGPFYPGQANDSVPWINLDENDEIGLDAMYAGVATGQPFPGDLLLFLAKANRMEYNYTAGNQFFVSATASAAIAASKSYTLANKDSPPAGDSTVASLPSNTIEIKAGWRRLTPTEAGSGRFYSTTVRFYRLSGNDTTYQDTVFGLVALHIIQKTPNRPYFVYATFEQADNLLTAQGDTVEDVNGNVNPGYDTLPPFDPVITSQNATAPAPDTGYTLANVQHLTPPLAAAVPGKRVYFRNSPGDSTTQGVVAINRRVHPIPAAVIAANTAAHAAIAAYNQQHGIASSPWQYYKLINVQYQPIAGKQPGVNYSGPDSSNFYQANAVVESNTNLQTFSGMFQPSFVDSATGAKVSRPGTITDWCAINNLGPGCTANGPFYNVLNAGHGFNMGGCMGCHGNAQVTGSDFSFILGASPYGNPTVQVADPQSAPNDTRKFFQFFSNVAQSAVPVTTTAAAAAAPAARR